MSAPLKIKPEFAKEVFDYAVKVNSKQKAADHFNISWHQANACCKRNGGLITRKFYDPEMCKIAYLAHAAGDSHQTIARNHKDIHDASHSKKLCKAFYERAKPNDDGSVVTGLHPLLRILVPRVA